MKKLALLLMVALTALPVMAVGSADIRDLAKAYNRRDQIDLAIQIADKGSKYPYYRLNVDTYDIDLQPVEVKEILKALKEINAMDIQDLSKKVGVPVERMPE